jgi:4,5-dihydroxyphthalate decarboxylase
MSKLQLSVAVGDYDRVRPLMDGAVRIDGVDPVFMSLPPEETFFRVFRGQDFDVCELSLSSFAVKTAARDCPYVGVPAFVSRAFRTTRSTCGGTASRRPPICGAGASACRNISSPPASGRASSWRTITA